MTPDDIRRARSIAQSKTRRVWQIVAEVAKATGVSGRAILGPRRDAKTVQARQLAMFIAYRDGMTQEAIGRAMGRDHTTVSAAISREAKRREQEAAE